MSYRLSMTREQAIIQAEGYVRWGESQIFRQHQVILNLASYGASTELALELLDLFQTVQAKHVEHLEGLRDAP
jgi:hypothetical protein